MPLNVRWGDDRNNDTNVNDRPVGGGRNKGEGVLFASFDQRPIRRIYFTERVGREVIARGTESR